MHVWLIKLKMTHLCLVILDNKRIDTNGSNPYEPRSVDFFMDEESLRFWIIPIVCIVAVLGIFSVSLEYKVNTVFPNAELERMEIKNMSCDEITAKDSANDYWTSENSQIGKAKATSCAKPQESQSSGLNPFVEFCNPGGFAPDKKIENNTHSFNHDTCVWDPK